MKSLEGIKLEEFGLESENVVINDKTAVITKKNWDYELSLKFQELMVEKVYDYKDESIFIFCNHPHCFTLGKGLQKNIDFGVNLIDFDPQLKEKLPYKVFDIQRGGGLTFHYPGQLVFYPIMSLEKKKIRVFDFLMDILKSTKEILERNYKIEDLDYERKLLGLWKSNFKIASIGLSARRFVSYHGLALNLFHDEEMMNTLIQVFPCGLPSDVYSPLETIMGELDESIFEVIKDELLSKYYNSF